MSCKLPRGIKPKKNNEEVQNILQYIKKNIMLNFRRNNISPTWFGYID
jgi:hypothetical protein